MTTDFGEVNQIFTPEGLRHGNPRQQFNNPKCQCKMPYKWKNKNEDY